MVREDGLKRNYDDNANSKANGTANAKSNLLHPKKADKRGKLRKGTKIVHVPDLNPSTHK